MKESTKTFTFSKNELLSIKRPAVKNSGIYFLFNGAEIMYVGQAIDVYSRINHHLTQNRIPFDSYSWIPCPPQCLSLLETEYIVKFKPRFNCTIPFRERYAVLSDHLDEYRKITGKPDASVQLMTEQIRAAKYKSKYANYYDPLDVAMFLDTTRRKHGISVYSPK